LASGSKAQRALGSRLDRIVRRHPEVSNWLFTKEVVVDDSELSHSHPVLTLGAGSPGVKTDMGLMSTFLHEEMHWHLAHHPDQLMLAIKDLKSLYPKVKVGRLEGGARNEESTYLHLLVCFLETGALSTLFGKKRAQAFAATKPYNSWIYRTVVHDHGRIGRIIEKRGLSIWIGSESARRPQSRKD